MNNISKNPDNKKAVWIFSKRLKIRKLSCAIGCTRLRTCLCDIHKAQALRFHLASANRQDSLLF